MASISGKTIQFTSVTPTSFDIVYSATFTPGTNTPDTGNISLFLGSGSIVAIDSYSETFSSETTVSKTYPITDAVANTTYGYQIGATLKDKDNTTEAYSGPGATSSVTTKVEMATLTVGTITDSSVVINYETPADGGARSKNIGYSLDGGTTWTTGATITGGSASSGSFTISNLDAGTTYNIKTRISNGRTTVGPVLTINTTGAASPALYGSVNGQTKKIEKLYGSVPTQVNTYSGEPRVAGTATFDASIFNANPTIKAIQGTISYLQFRDDAGRVYLRAFLTDSTQLTLFDSEGTPGTFEEYGITQHVLDQVCYIDLTATTTTQNLTKLVKKLYGSVNGQTKLIFDNSI